jgi:hypothetical protein
MVWLNAFPAAATFLAACVAVTGVMIGAGFAFFAAFRNGSIALKQAKMQIQAQDRARVQDHRNEQARTATAFSAEFNAAADTIKEFNIYHDYTEAESDIVGQPKMPRYRIHDRYFTVFLSDPMTMSLPPPQISKIGLQAIYRCMTLFEFVTEGKGNELPGVGVDRHKAFRQVAISAGAIEADCRDVAAGLDVFAATMSE